MKVRWDEGRLEGPAGLTGVLRLHDRLRKRGLGPPLALPGGAGFDREGLSHPLGAILLMKQVLDSVDDLDGMKVGAARRRGGRLGAEERAVLQQSRRVPA